MRLNLLCAEISDLLTEGTITMPAGHENSAARPKKKRKVPENTSTVSAIRRSNTKKTTVKKRGFYRTYEQSSERAPARTPLRCAIRTSYLSVQAKIIETRSEVPAWWGKLPEMLAGAGITLSEWRQRILDEEPEDSDSEISEPVETDGPEVGGLSGGADGEIGGGKESAHDDRNGG